MTLGLRYLPLTVTLTNFYDARLARRGSLPESDVRCVGVRGAVVDLCVLSLGIPADVANLLGLTAGEPGSDRLTPVELGIRDRRCSIDPFLVPGHAVVVGHVALTALGLKYDPEWGVMDDTGPDR